MRGRWARPKRVSALYMLGAPKSPLPDIRQLNTTRAPCPLSVEHGSKKHSCIWPSNHTKHHHSRQMRKRQATRRTFFLDRQVSWLRVFLAQRGTLTSFCWSSSRNDTATMKSPTDTMANPTITNQMSPGASLQMDFSTPSTKNLFFYLYLWAPAGQGRSFNEFLCRVGRVVYVGGR